MLVGMIETIQLQLLLATFAGWVGRRQTRAIAYLIEENRVIEAIAAGQSPCQKQRDNKKRLPHNTGAVTIRILYATDSGSKLPAKGGSRV
jgi:hypothetical protein